MQERKEMFPSHKKPNSAVSAKPHTAEFQNSDFQMRRVTETTFPTHPLLFRAQLKTPAGSRGKRLQRRNYRPPHPHRSHGMCSSAPQAGALKEQPNPHLEENLQFHKPAWDRQAATSKVRSSRGAFFPSLCWRSIFRSRSLAVRSSVGFTCCLHMARDRIITCTHA